MGIRTDLALELEKNISQSQAERINGLIKTTRKGAGFNITEIEIKTKDAEKLIGKPKGKYITLEACDNSLTLSSDDFKNQVDLISGEIKALLKSTDNTLVIGLGNLNITPDSLGPKVSAQIFATRHLNNTPELRSLSLGLSSVSVLSPGVMGQTGIETMEIVASVCEEIRPESVIVIDALACSDFSHLGKTVQLSNVGISPGSGVENKRKELSYNTLGVPVIAIGVPTVIDMQTAIENHTGELETDLYKGMMVTPKTIDKLIAHSSHLISMSINRALNPELTIEEITSLI